MQSQRFVHFTRMWEILISLFAAGLLTACSNPSPQAFPLETTYRGGIPTGGGGGDGDTDGATDDDDDDDSSTGGEPLIIQPIRAVGYSSSNSYSFTVQTRRRLIIKFAPGQQDQLIAGTGASPQYSKLGVYIKVGNHDQATPLLRNGEVGTAQESTPVDYSSDFAKNCAANAPDLMTNPACLVNVTITVSKPNYDYWCLNFPYQACVSPGYTRVESTHPWNGSVFVETDDTVSMD